MKREIFLLAGEASGDARGAELIGALRARDSSLSFSGMGGPRMREAGMEVLADVSNQAVVGVVEVLKHYGFFKRVMNRFLEEIPRRRPIAVIGVDYPGFNLRLLQKIRRLLDGKTDRASQSAKPRSIKLVQYISPQLWAWNEGRKWKMAQYLDEVLCIFPFEPRLYEETGLKAVFVGHPLARSMFHSEETRDSRLLAFFPGSREKEICAHMPVFAGVEAHLKIARPMLHIAYACFAPQCAQLIQSYVSNARLEDPSFLQSSAVVGVVCSGTATMEAAVAGLPMCVIYRVGWPTYWMGHALIKVPFLAMPNLLVGRRIIKEFIQSDFTVSNVTREVERLLDDPAVRETIRTGYGQVRALLGDGKAAEKAADEVLKLF